MKKIGFASFILTMLTGTVLAQSDIVAIKHKYDAGIEAINDSMINEMFFKVGDSSPGNFPYTGQQYKKEPKFPGESFDYRSIRDTKVKRSRAGNVLKGIAIGGAIGLTPAILSAIFGKGEGGAYVSVVTFPLGLITGGILGATSKRKNR